MMVTTSIARNQHQNALVPEGESQVDQTIPDIFSPNQMHGMLERDISWSRNFTFGARAQPIQRNLWTVQCASNSAWPAALMDPSPCLVTLVASESLRMRLCWPMVASNIWNMWGPWRKLQLGVARTVQSVMKFCPGSGENYCFLRMCLSKFAIV